MTGEQIGNFPQAFTHLALIDAAITLNDRLDAGPFPAVRRYASLPAQRTAHQAESTLTEHAAGAASD